LLRVLVFSLLIAFASASSGTTEVLTFSKVVFEGQNNGGADKWAQLRFSIINPRFGSNGPISKRRLSFTIDTDLSGRYLRTDLRFRSDWLSLHFFPSSGKSDMYLGSRKPSSEQKRDLNKLDLNERLIAAWIIANSDELIDFAVNSGKFLPYKDKWEEMGRNNLFEDNIRKNLGPFFRKELNNYDKYSKHSSKALKGEIQPSLARLGYYDGKIDGLWGAQTRGALLQFEREKGLFPDGVNYGAERSLLTDKIATDFTDKSKLDELKKELQRSKQREDRLFSFAQSRREIIVNLEKEIAALKARADLSSNNKTETELQESLQQAQRRGDKLFELAQDRSEKIAALEQRLKAFQAKVGTDESLSSLKENVSVLNNELEQLKALRDEKELQIKKLSGQIDLYREKQKLYSEANTTLRDQVAVLENKSQNLQAQLNFTKSESVLAIERLEKENKTQKQLLLNTDEAQIILNQKIVTLELEQKKLKLALDEALAANQITSGPAEFKLSDEWLDLERYLAVQEVRFCQILSNYKEKAKAADESKNQLRQNLVARDRDNDIAALIPNGNFDDWVAKVVEIYATPSGDAAFLLRLPCEVTFGSGKLSSKKDLDGVYAATAKQGGLIYNQLAQLAEGDTVLISGKILTYDDIGALNEQLKFVTTLVKDEKINTSESKSRNAPDYFSNISYLSRL
jgi:peptidoglycan hydrolase-like protein with peptidoglycan-binding domain